MREALLKKVGFENPPVQSKQGVQLTPLAAIQMEPTGHKQPALPPYQIPCCSSSAEELGPPHFVHRSAGMLQNVKLVVHDPALRHHCSRLCRNGSHMSTHAARIALR